MLITTLCLAPVLLAAQGGRGTQSANLQAASQAMRAGKTAEALAAVREELKANPTSTAAANMELKKFRRVHLEPGAREEITFQLDRDDLRMLDQDLHWTVEPGAFRVMVGSSSKDIRLRGQLQIRQ